MINETKKRTIWTFHPQVNANKETQVVLATKLGSVPSVLNSIITKQKDTKKSRTKCDSFCG
jgi:hypothetical protein